MPNDNCVTLTISGRQRIALAEANQEMHIDARELASCLRREPGHEDRTHAEAREAAVDLLAGRLDWPADAPTIEVPNELVNGLYLWIAESLSYAVSEAEPSEPGIVGLERADRLGRLGVADEMLAMLTALAGARDPVLELYES
jgi:hypothetical protein